MTKKLILKIFIFMLLCNFSVYGALAQTIGPTVTETFLNGLLFDRPLFPASTVHCKASGSLSKILDRPIGFHSQGNAFFVNKVVDNIPANNKMAIFQSGTASSSNKTYVASLFIKATGVTQTNLRDLIIKKKVVITNNAQVIFAVYVTENNITKTYLYDGAIEDSTLATRFTHVGNITSSGIKYIVASGDIKINFPRPPVLLGGNENITGPGEIICDYHKLPLDDDYLPGVETAFDGTLVNDIKTEAGL